MEYGTSYPTTVGVLVLWVVLQVGMVRAQDKFGARFFVPERVSFFFSATPFL